MGFIKLCCTNSFLTLFIIYITRLTDTCYGKDNNHKNATSEGPVGHLLNQTQFDILCNFDKAQFGHLSDLCKGDDKFKYCDTISYQLYFDFHQCQNIMPDPDRPNETYDVCGCTNNSLAKLGDNTSWTYITSANLVTPILYKKQSCTNGLKVLHTKK
uniref:Uncharacterized protein n=1 Tax=Cacopsylla melanoneura TaxID=428564 RepID=A0A8D9A8S2_9HEMI